MNSTNFLTAIWGHKICDDILDIKSINQIKYILVHKDY